MCFRFQIDLKLKICRWKVRSRKSTRKTSQTRINSFLAPKRSSLAEQSSALTESSGGLAFEVKLAESPRHGTNLAAIHFLSPSAKANQNESNAPLTPEVITEKLKRATERRISLEQLRATLLAAENSRPNEISKIKDQQAEGFFLRYSKTEQKRRSRFFRI